MRERKIGRVTENQRNKRDKKQEERETFCDADLDAHLSLFFFLSFFVLFFWKWITPKLQPFRPSIHGDSPSLAPIRLLVTMARVLCRARGSSNRASLG